MVINYYSNNLRGSMKNYFTLVLAIVVLFATNALSAAEPQTKEGCKSLFFGLNGLSNLGVDNSYLGFQYLFQDGMGGWASIGFNSKNYKPNENAEEEKYTKIYFDIAFIYYAFQKGPVAMWISPEVGIGIGTDDISLSKITDKSFWGGVDLGVEWWAFENISLSASVFIGYENQTVKTEYKNSSLPEDEETTNTFGIIGDEGKFTVSFYF